MKRALRSQATRVEQETDVRAVPVSRARSGKTPLGPAESFVLGYVDGRRSIQDIAALVALSARETAVVCERLRELEVLELRAPGPAKPEIAVDLDLDVDEGWDGPPATERRR